MELIVAKKRPKDAADVHVDGRRDRYKALDYADLKDQQETLSALCGELKTLVDKAGALKMEAFRTGGRGMLVSAIDILETVVRAVSGDVSVTDLKVNRMR